MKLSNLILLLSLVFVVASCNKDDFNKGDGKNSDKELCFEYVYPISFEMPDGSTLTLASEEEWETEFKAWYEAHPDSKEEAELIYPVGITYEDGEIITINEEAEMEDYKNDCKEDGDKELCFALVYPVTYTMPDGSTITGNDEEETWAAIKAWYEDNPDVAAKPALNYPVGVTFDDGDAAPHVVNDESEMEALKEDCKDGDWDKDSCFEFVYPITYVMPDDTEITGDDDESLWGAIKAWYDDHPDVAAEPSLQFPVSITFDDGDGAPQVINNQTELDAVKDDCVGDDWDKACFDLVYPLTYIMPDDTAITGNDKEELWLAIKAWYEDHPDVAAKPSLQYPVEIVFEDGATQSIEDEAAMEAAKEDCE